MAVAIGGTVHGADEGVNRSVLGMRAVLMGCRARVMLCLTLEFDVDGLKRAKFGSVYRRVVLETGVLADDMSGSMRVERIGSFRSGGVGGGGTWPEKPAMLVNISTLS